MPPGAGEGLSVRLTRDALPLAPLLVCDAKVILLLGRQLLPLGERGLHPGPLTRALALDGVRKGANPVWGALGLDEDIPVSKVLDPARDLTLPGEPPDGKAKPDALDSPRVAQAPSD